VNKKDNLSFVLGLTSLIWPFIALLIWAISLFMTLSFRRGVFLVANWLHVNVLNFSILFVVAGISAIILGIKQKRTSAIVLGAIGALFSLTLFWMNNVS